MLKSMHKAPIAHECVEPGLRAQTQMHPRQSATPAGRSRNSHNRKTELHFRPNECEVAFLPCSTGTVTRWTCITVNSDAQQALRSRARYLLSIRPVGLELAFYCVAYICVPTLQVELDNTSLPPASLLYYD